MQYDSSPSVERILIFSTKENLELMKKLEQFIAGAKIHQKKIYKIVKKKYVT